MKLVVGFGNPGEQYKNTRHNLGFLALDRLAQRYHTEISLKKKKSVTGKIKVGSEKVFLLKPQTFVNLSGEAVLYMASFLRISPENIIIICDDSNLSFGEIKVHKYGSSGGHNGIKSLIHFLKSDNFVRIRIGIGRPLGDIPMENYVLGKFSKDELSMLDPILDETCDILERILIEGVDSVL